MDLFSIHQKSNKLLITILKALLTLSVLLGWVYYITTHYEKIEFRHKLEHLNVLMPRSYTSLVNFIENKSPLEPKEFKKYYRFYKILVKYFPESTEAQSLLGFCNYYSGRMSNALDSYTLANTQQPDVFWFPYNMGIIHYQTGQYAKTIETLGQAVEKDPNDTLIFINNSKIVYRGLWMESIPLAQQSRARLIKGYSDAYKLLIFSALKLEIYPLMLEYAEKAGNLALGDKDFFLYFSGLAAFRLKDYGRSNRYFQAYIRLNPLDAEVYQYLGKNFIAIGKTAKAQAYFQKAKKLAETNEARGLDYDKITVRVF